MPQLHVLILNHKFDCLSSLRINFADDNKLELANSETLKLVQELDNTKDSITEPGWSNRNK